MNSTSVQLEFLGRIVSGAGGTLFVDAQGLTCSSSPESLCSSFQDPKSVNFSERQLQSKVLPSPRTRYRGVKGGGRECLSACSEGEVEHFGCSTLCFTSKGLFFFFPLGQVIEKMVLR